MMTADGAAEPLTRGTPVDGSSAPRLSDVLMINARTLEHALLVRSPSADGRRVTTTGRHSGRRSSREDRQQRRARRQMGGGPQLDERIAQAGRRRAARYQQVAIVSEAQRRFRSGDLGRQVARVCTGMASFGALLVSLQASAFPLLTGSESSNVNGNGQAISQAQAHIQVGGRGVALQEQSPAHLLLGLLRSQRPDDIDGLRSTRARQLLAQLWRHLVSGCCFLSVSVLLGVWLFVRASFILVASQGPECQGQMRNWLLIFICMQISCPSSVLVAMIARRYSPHFGRRLLQFAWPTSVILLLGWTITAQMYASPPSACPAFRAMPARVIALQSTSLLCLAISFVYLLAAHPIILRLNDLVANGGILSEAARTIAEIPSSDLPPKEECSICLGGVEDSDDEVRQDREPQGAATRSQASFSSLASEEDLESSQALQTIDLEPVSPTVDMPPPPKSRPPWRRLKCGHRFHEQCLFQWLRKTKRCPLCRCHMREAPAWRRNQLAETAVTSADAAISQATSSSSSVTALQPAESYDASAESSGSADARPLTMMVATTTSGSCSSNGMFRSSSCVHSDSPSGYESQKGESS